MNKLTDKIEIRISHTEKARLSELATDEGKSVSELVRGLVRRYVDLNTSTRIIRRGWLPAAGAVAAALIGGLFLGTLWPDTAAEAHDAESGRAVYNIRFEMVVPFGPVDSEQLRQVFVIDPDASELDGEKIITRSINARDRLYQVDFDYTQLGLDPADLQVSICRKADEPNTDCQETANLTARLAADYGSSVHVVADAGELVHLSVDRILSSR